MGCGISKPMKGGNKDTDVNLSKAVDIIAAKLITNDSYLDLEKLKDPKYCDKLIIMTTKVLKKFFNTLEVEFLEQRTNYGNVVDIMDKKKLFYLKTGNMKDLDEKSSVRKHRMCMGIAKFYIKIAHLFAAISTTINPMYTYVDENGKKQTVSLLEKKSHKKIHKATVYNLCSRRQNALGMVINENDGDIFIDNKICDLNNPKVSKRQGEGGEIKKTQEEPKDDIHNSDNAGVKSGSSGTFEKPEEIAKQVDENDVVREGEMREGIQKHTNEQVGGEPMDMREQPVVMGEQPLENKKILEPPAPAPVEQVKLGEPLAPFVEPPAEQAKIEEPPAPVEQEKIRVPQAEVIAPPVSMKPLSAGIMKYKKIQDDAKTLNLGDDYGIPELERLYFDKYDFNQAKYTGKSKKSEEKYKKDLETFYKAFTGQDTMPEHIQRFSDIPLNDYHNFEQCTSKQWDFKYKKSDFVDSAKKSDLFDTYAQHYKNMLAQTKEDEAKLFEILEEVFVYLVDTKYNKSTLIVNPALNMESLDELIEKTRQIIIEMYVRCEKNFVEGVKLFNAIVLAVKLETGISRKQGFQKMKMNILGGGNGVNGGS